MVFGRLARTTHVNVDMRGDCSVHTGCVPHELVCLISINSHIIRPLTVAATDASVVEDYEYLGAGEGSQDEQLSGACRDIWPAFGCK